MELSGITHLLDIPHFGHNQYIKNCVKNLLSVVQRGYLWLNPSVYIDAELIHMIMGLPMVGEDPSLCFGDKTSDKAIIAKIYLEHNL